MQKTRNSHGLKTYFIKASELRDRFTAARRMGKTGACLNGLVRPSCLIIDEIGHCAFDKENTRLFFDLIDRRYNKEGNFNMIFTSNKNPALWREDFEEDATLLCTLDRISDWRFLLHPKWLFLLSANSAPFIWSKSTVPGGVFI